MAEIKSTGHPCHRPFLSTQPILQMGPKNEFIMALIVGTYSQDACGLGSGPCPTLGRASGLMAQGSEV